MLLVRGLLAALAVVVCVWFGLGIRQARDQSRADALIHQPSTPSPAVTAQILQLLNHAALLNPDREIDLLRVQAEVRAGESARAAADARRVVRDEPLNVNAWVVLGFAAGSRDPAIAALASAKERELAPPVRPAP